MYCRSDKALLSLVTIMKDQAKQIGLKNFKPGMKPIHNTGQMSS